MSMCFMDVGMREVVKPQRGCYIEQPDSENLLFLLPVPWCHCRLQSGRLPAALGTSMTASFSASRMAPGALSSSQGTRRPVHEEDNVQSHDQHTCILWGGNHRKRVPARWFTEQVDADRN